jgi:hypothetical protein
VPRLERVEKEENAVSAKHKLNSAHFLGAALVAGLFGLVTGSIIVFLIALGAGLAVAHQASHIR